MMVVMMLVWFLFHKSSCSCESFCRVGTFVNFRCHAISISFNGNVTRIRPYAIREAVRFYLGQLA